MKGFKKSKVDYFIKLGGSLMSNFKLLSKVLDNESSKKNIVIFPGGGVIDNLIEEIDVKNKLQPIVHHQLCARAQDQTGLFFYSHSNNSTFFTDFVEMDKIFSENRLAIILPMKQILSLDIFEMSGEITSDTMSAFFSNFVKAKTFVILTNVDGLLEDVDDSNSLIENITAKDLIKYGHCVIDMCLAHYLIENKLDCIILNGLDIKNLKNFFSGENYKGTRITGQ